MTVLFQFAAPNTQLANAFFQGESVFSVISDVAVLTRVEEGRNLVAAGGLLRPHLDTIVEPNSHQLWERMRDLNLLLRGYREAGHNEMPPAVNAVGKALSAIDQERFILAVKFTRETSAGLFINNSPVIPPAESFTVSTSIYTTGRILADAIRKKKRRGQGWDVESVAPLVAAFLQWAKEATDTSSQEIASYCDNMGNPPYTRCCARLRPILQYSPQEMAEVSSAVFVAFRDSDFFRKLGLLP